MAATVIKTFLQWDQDGQTIGLEVDATPSQGYESTAETTDHPVENGAAVIDHVRPGNDTFTLEGIISNAPVLVPTTQMGGVTRSVGAVPITVDGKTEQATALRWSAPFDRVRICDALLRSAVKAGAVVALTTGLRSEENLVITRYGASRATEVGQAVAITLEFRQLRIVTTQRVAVPAVRALQVPPATGAQEPVPNSSFARNLGQQIGQALSGVRS